MSALDGGAVTILPRKFYPGKDTLAPINHFLVHGRLALNVLTEHKFYVHHALWPALKGTALLYIT